METVDFDVMVGELQKRYTVSTVNESNNYVDVDEDKIGVPNTDVVYNNGWAISAVMRKNGGLRIWFRELEVEEVEKTITTTQVRLK